MLKKISIIIFCLIPKYSFAKDFTPSVNITSETFISEQGFQGNTKVKNFAKAKSILKKANYFGIKEEIYCGCEFYKGKIPLNAKCGIQARKNQKRAYKIEFEHIVPFENQVGHTVVWDSGIPECKGKKGRKCASKIFAHMEGDLWNLWPAAGELNGDRSNYSFGMISGPRNQYGKCNFKIEDRKIEPRDEVKALIGFTYLYFQKTYAKYLKTNFISGKNEKLFAAWVKMPLTAAQCEWARKVNEVQGNRNGDLLEACDKLAK
jgi:deoxyribonuclease-1